MYSGAVSECSFVKLDLRSRYARGEAPLSEVLAKAVALKQDEALCVITPVEPVPAYHLMTLRGFSHRTRIRADGSWKTVFERMR